MPTGSNPARAFFEEAKAIFTKCAYCMYGSWKMKNAWTWASSSQEVPQKNPVLFAAFVSIIMQVCFVKIISVKRYRSTIPVNSHGLS